MFFLLGEVEGAEVNLQDVPQDALLDALPSETDLQTGNCKSGCSLELRKHLLFKLVCNLSLFFIILVYDVVPMVLQPFLYGESKFIN